jgi:Protein of unknown function (DUF3224)
MMRAMPELDTKLTIGSWDEPAYRELSDGGKFTKAEVALSVADDAIEVTGTMDSVMFYADEKTSFFAGLLRFDGRLGDRTGSFVLTGNGDYDGTRARLDLTIAPGSGTGELAGIRGTATSVSTHEDYPYMPLTLSYTLE